MTITLEERIRRAALQLDQAVEERSPQRAGTTTPATTTAAPMTYLADRPSGARRPIAWAAAAAALVLVAGAAVVLRPSGVQTVAAPAASLVDGEGWERLPGAPIPPRFQHLAVSTGDGVLVWGGYADAGRSDGAYFDARTQTWRTVPRAPLAGNRGDAVGTWTGSEVVVVNGIDGRVKAAAYSPAANRWRALPDPPLANAANMMTRAVFVDGSVVVVAVSEEGESGVRNETAVLDPATSAWRIGNPPSPAFGSGFDAVVVGSEVVVVGRIGMGGKGCGNAVVSAYRPAANAWRTIDATPANNVVAGIVASIGTQVFVSGGSCGDQSTGRQAFLLDPAAGTWRPVAEPPPGVRGDERYAEVWTGRHVVGFDSQGTPVFYEPATDQWVVGISSPLGRRLVETPWTWAGGKLLVFSGGVSTGGDGRCCDPLDGGYTYTTPS